MTQLFTYFSRYFALLSALFVCATGLSAAPINPGQANNQIVIISFDGAHDNALWARSRQMGQDHFAQFTYFISCTFLLTKARAKDIYNPPKHATGASNIGFAPNEKDISERLNHIWQASLEGHEIGSHGCGHFDGAKWSEKDWQTEFEQFQNIALSAWQYADIKDQEPGGWASLFEDKIKGFRAPYLSTNKALFEALENNGFTYDASLVSMGPKDFEMAFQRAHPYDRDLISFSLPLIPEGPSARPVIAMDYNFYMRHSKAKEMPARADEFEARAFDALQKAFDTQYEGARIPLQIGYHFVKMNDGAYWNALETFIATNCVRQDVDCISYEAAIDRLMHQAETN